MCKRLLLYSAPAAVAAFWAVLVSSIAANPGFDVLRHEFSLLGTEWSANPSLYNYGLALTGILIALYGVVIVTDKEWRQPGLLIVAAAASLVTSSLISGHSAVHVYATRMFFLLLAVSFAHVGMEWLKRGVKGGAFILLVSLAAPLIWLAVKAAKAWPGALGEIYGILVVDILLLYDWRLRICAEKMECIGRAVALN